MRRALRSLTFDFTGVGVPDEIIFGLAYNTSTYGYHRDRHSGPPYDSLNFALSSVPPLVGSQPLPDTAYWNATTAGVTPMAARAESEYSARIKSGLHGAAIGFNPPRLNLALAFCSALDYSLAHALFRDAS